jgi:hypothetical protein
MRSAYLELIDQNVFARRENLRYRLEQLQTEDEQIIKVERVGLSQRLFILAIELASQCGLSASWTMYSPLR